MAEIGDIRPLQPTWHKRPGDKVDKNKREEEADNQQRDQRKDSNEDDDGKPHVDEYA